MKHFIPAALALLAFSSPVMAEEALFVMGTSMDYRAVLEEENCMGMDAPDWKCDDAGCCKRKLAYKIQCKVKQVASFGPTKASVVECSDDRKEREMDFTYPASGVWIRNKAGIYHFSSVSEVQDAVDVGTEKLAKARQKKSKKMDYLKIAYDMDPFIPAGIKNDREEKTCDPDIEGMCTVVRIQAANAAWCRTDEMSGGDEAVNHVCIDANKAILRFEMTFSGGIYYKVVADQ